MRSYNMNFTKTLICVLENTLEPSGHLLDFVMCASVKWFKCQSSDIDNLLNSGQLAESEAQVTESLAVCPSLSSKPRGASQTGGL